MPNDLPDRKYYHVAQVDMAANEKIEANYNPATKEFTEVAPEAANLISSLCGDGMHAPVIDFDIPIEVYPSSQLGHHHLYINKKITWIQYKNILAALWEAGLIENGYYQAALQQIATYVRPVGVIKIDAPKGAHVLKENAILRKQNYELKAKIASF